MKAAIETSRWAAEEHGDGLRALTSLGNESALLPDILEHAGLEVRFITIDSGFRFPETEQFQHQLTGRYGIELGVYGPDQEDIDTIKKTSLWETELDYYHEITRHEPLRRAIEEEGATALLSGIRAGQTANRATLDVVGTGNEGETRIHPLLHWSEEQAEDYFGRLRLLRHPLYYQGYGSVGDWTTTHPGAGREGRELPNSECGLHIAADGQLVRTQ